MEVRNADQSTKCGFMVLCVDMLKRPCVRDIGHKGGHNPFRNEGLPNEEMVKELPVSIPPVQNQAPSNPPVINTTGEQCIWTGTRGRCMYAQGHFPATPHREFVPEGF